MKARTVTFAIALALFTTSAVAQGYREGTWWRDLTSSEKVAYTTGLLDGGTVFAVQVLLVNVVLKRMPIDAAEPTGPYGNVAKRLTDGVRPAAIVDALDAFYREPANRPIDTATATFIALNKFAGMDEQTLSTLINGARANPDPRR